MSDIFPVYSAFLTTSLMLSISFLTSLRAAVVASNTRYFTFSLCYLIIIICFSASPLVSIALTFLTKPSNTVFLTASFFTALVILLKLTGVVSNKNYHSLSI